MSIHCDETVLKFNENFIKLLNSFIFLYFIDFYLDTNVTI